MVAIVLLMSYILLIKCRVVGQIIRSNFEYGKAYKRGKEIPLE